MLAFALVTMALLTAGYVLWPVLAGGEISFRLSREDTALGRLELQKQRLLDNIAELDFEHSMGKLAQSDYTTMRDGLEVAAAQTLEQIEMLEGARGELKPIAQDPEQIFCIMCGDEMPTRARFCPSCGEKRA